MQHCPACLTSGSLMGSEGGSNGLKRDGAVAPAHFTTCHPLSCRWGQEPHGAGFWREYTLLWDKHMHRETDTHKTRPSNLDPTSDPAVRCYNGIYHNLSPFRQNTTVTCSLSEQSTKGVYCACFACSSSRELQGIPCFISIKTLDVVLLRTKNTQTVY